MIVGDCTNCKITTITAYTCHLKHKAVLRYFYIIFSMTSISRFLGFTGILHILPNTIYNKIFIQFAKVSHPNTCVE